MLAFLALAIILSLPASHFAQSRAKESSVAGFAFDSRESSLHTDFLAPSQHALFSSTAQLHVTFGNNEPSHASQQMQEQQLSEQQRVKEEIQTRNKQLRETQNRVQDIDSFLQRHEQIEQQRREQHKSPEQVRLELEQVSKILGIEMVAPQRAKVSQLPPSEHRKPASTSNNRYDEFCTQKPSKSEIQVISIPGTTDKSIERAHYQHELDSTHDAQRDIVIGWAVNEGYIPIDYMRAGASHCENDQCVMRCNVPCRIKVHSALDGNYDAYVNMYRMGLVPGLGQFLSVAYLTEASDLKQHELFEIADLVMAVAHGAHTWLAAHNDKFYTFTSNDPDSFDYSRLFCSTPEKDWTYYATIFNQNPMPERMDLVYEISRWIPVLRFGGAYEGVPMPTDFQLHNSDSNVYAYKEAISSRYPFTLAFENEKRVDWVTEKVYNALISGAVPIYWGAANIDQYVPSHSIIRMDDFASVEELAQHLEYLRHNQTAYNEYLAWRHPPYIWRNTPLMRGSKLNCFCGICDAVSAHLQSPLPKIMFNTTTEKWVPFE